MIGPSPVADRTPVWHLYRTLVGVGVACGILIVSVFEWTKPIIRANRIEARRAAVLRVMPGAATSRTFRWEGERLAPAPDDSEGDDLAFAGFDASGTLVGVAVQAHGSGYQDEIRVLLGLSFERSAIVGLAVLESRETPGLGDRAETDEAFQANFRALDVALDDRGAALRHPIEFRKGRKASEEKRPWQIDGITGATVTSRAIAKMVAETAALQVPRLFRQRADFMLEGR
ncbi:MAG: RnfABCDGE type electron transport complex subunit G [Planctomycetota bacterium]